MGESFSHEAHSTLETYELQAEQNGDVWVSNQWTPYENLTDNDLLREFSTSEDPVVIELLKRIGAAEHVRTAFMTFYEESEHEKERLYEEARSGANEDGLTRQDLEELAEERLETINRITNELTQEKKNHSRALKRAMLWKNQLREAKQLLKYETRSVERLETRTRRKINV